MKHFFTLFLLTITLLSFQAKGQEASRIAGQVSGPQNKSLEAATISLQKTKDSTLVKTTATTADGKFAFDQIAAGDYFITITAVGHTKKSLPVHLDPNEKLDLKPVTMEVSAKDLTLVTVVATKPFIEHKTDRTVVNVDASPTSAGSSALEILEKSPGITVDKDGNISLKGKQGVMVMLDGRPSYLSGPELVNLLKSMNANQLDQIEIMTNPPAKYDAAGNSGIINIKTKKNKVRGFNGNLSAGYSQGKYWRTNNSINLNYRTGKINAFSSLSYNKGYGFQQLDILRKYRNEDDKSIDAIFEQSSHMKNVRESKNVKAGIDYYLSQKTTIGFVATGFTAPEKFQGLNTSYLKNGSEVLDSIVYTETYNRNSWKNGSLNLNFRHQFDSAGRELTADVDYVKYASANRQDLINTSFQPDWVKTNQAQLYGDLPVDINIYSAKLDYTQTFRGVKFDAGLKTSFVNTANTAAYYNLSSGNWTPDYGKTNRFDYSENINAAYVNFSKQFKKFGAQLGLRYENTRYEGNQYGNPTRNDSSFSRSYNSLFPTVFLTYKVDEKNQLGFNVGRRIDRPAYQDLNPFLFFIDSYTYQAGNPYLKPQYSTNVEISHTYNQFLTTTINYSQTNNAMNESFEQSGYATIVREDNYGQRNNAGIAVNAQIPVTKWFTSIVYANYSYTEYKGMLHGEMLDVQGETFMMNVNNQLKFSKGWSAELSGFYRSKGVDGQITVLPFGQVSAGVSKQVLKDKGSVRLNIRDMFYTQQIEGYMNFQRTEAHFWNKRDSRMANITFTYRFGKTIKDNRSNRKTGGSTEESNRVKLGGS